MEWNELGNCKCANHSVKLWHGGFGTANAGLTAGTSSYGSNVVSCTEEWNGTNWSEGPSALIPSNMKAVSIWLGSQNDTLLAGFVQNSTYQPNNLLNNPNTWSDTIWWNDLPTSATLGVRRFGMSAAGQNTNVAFFASGLDNASPYKAECTIEVETFVATASFSHIEALELVVV